MPDHVDELTAQGRLILDVVTRTEPSLWSELSR
jgi:hypothetical protein